jgi:hypothetical protein
MLNAHEMEEVALQLSHHLRKTAVGEFRMFGGLACWLHSPGCRALFEDERECDLDLYAPTADLLALQVALKSFGFSRSQREVGTVVAFEFRRRAKDASQDIHIYLGSLKFSHRVSIGKRIHDDWPTLPLAELLLTKLQIHFPKEKDLRDICMLLVEHTLGDVDGEIINCRILSEMCGRNWGLWRDATSNLRAVSEVVESAPLDANVKKRVREKLHSINQCILDAKKTLVWRARARIGERFDWWDPVNEWS